MHYTPHMLEPIAETLLGEAFHGDWGRPTNTQAALTAWVQKERQKDIELRVDVPAGNTLADFEAVVKAAGYYMDYAPNVDAAIKSWVRTNLPHAASDSGWENDPDSADNKALGISTFWGPGHHHRFTGVVFIRSDLSDGMKARTLVHEWAHGQSQREADWLNMIVDERGATAMAESLVELTAGIVMKALGADHKITNYTESYINGWMGPGMASNYDAFRNAGLVTVAAKLATKFLNELGNPDHHPAW